MTHNFKFKLHQKVIAIIDGKVIEGEIERGNYYQNMAVGESSETEIYMVKTNRGTFEVYADDIYTNWDAALDAIKDFENQK